MMTQAEIARYHEVGWTRPASVRLPEALIEPVRRPAHAAARQARWQEMLSGVHNPFGRHVCTADAWHFLDIAESPLVVDLVAAVLGPDIVLWDSELYKALSEFSAEEVEWWPTDPLAGTIVIASIERGDLVLIDITRLREIRPLLPPMPGLHYALRYMPATSRFNRDPRFAPNRRAAEARVLVNYAARPIWLLRGEDRAGSDFAAGFAMPPPQWAAAAGPQAKTDGPEALGGISRER